MKRPPPRPASHVDALLRALWPAPATVEYTGRWIGRRSAGTQFLPIPTLNRTTMLVPRRPRRATAAVLRGYRASAGGRTRMLIRGVALAARMGLGDLLPHRVLVRDAHGQSIADYLAQALGRPVHLGIYIGPARAVQKPVVQVVSAQARTIAFAKIGVTSYTRDLVRSEAQILEELNTREWQHLRVPRVLHHGTWNENEVLVLEALNRTASALTSDGVMTAAMIEVARCRTTSTSTVLISSYWSSLGSRINALTGESARHLSEAYERLGHSLVADDPKLEFGSWHGDWAGWNMTVSGDRVLVWDWELFKSDVPLGFDSLHRLVQDSVVFGGLTPVESYTRARRRCIELLAPFGVAAVEATVTNLLYMMEIATRYIEVGEHGTTMSDLDSWLQPVLTEALTASCFASRKA